MRRSTRDEGGHIELAVEPSPSAGEYPDATIRVKDNGRGISPDVLARLFEPSTHEERLNSGAHGGLGIGLIVVRGLVEMHGGVVEARSEGPMRGSEFTVRLPLLTIDEFDADGHPGPRLAAGAASDAPCRGAANPRRGRQPGLRLSMTLLLELAGPRGARGAQRPGGAEVAAERKPDVILLDIGMPGMNGYEVARQLRAAGRFRRDAARRHHRLRPRFRHEQTHRPVSTITW